MNKLSFEVLIKEAVLNTSLKVKGFEAIAQPNGTKWDIFVLSEDEPEKKFIFKKEQIGAQVTQRFKELKEILSQANAKEFVNGLSFLHVVANKNAKNEDKLKADVDYLSNQSAAKLEHLLSIFAKVIENVADNTINKQVPNTHKDYQKQHQEQINKARNDHRNVINNALYLLKTYKSDNIKKFHKEPKV